MQSVTCILMQKCIVGKWQRLVHERSFHSTAWVPNWLKQCQHHSFRWASWINWECRRISVTWTYSTLRLLCAGPFMAYCCCAKWRLFRPADRFLSYSFIEKQIFWECYFYSAYGWKGILTPPVHTTNFSCCIHKHIFAWDRIAFGEVLFVLMQY